ncbi:actin family [Chytriomyces sp. MP71]|nr:actin family [Chytriomyces sp. MP71]
MTAGEDVSAIVIDVGSATTKVGFAGDDSPKGVFPSTIGLVETGAQRQHFIGENRAFAWRDKMEMRNPMANGVVNDWDALEAIWEYTFKERLGSPAAEHPLLVSEAAWATRDVREKLIEIAFEKFGVPAFYIAKAPVLAAFAAGRSSAIVVDSGAEMTSVVPVVDGFVLKKAIQKQNLAGNAVSQYAKALFDANQIQVAPHYMIRSKLPLDAGHRPPPETYLQQRPGTTRSFHDFATLRVLNEFKETVCQVSEYNFHPASLQNRPPKPFEFPDGYNNSFGMERYRIPEILFQPAMIPGLPEGSAVGVPQLFGACVQACDSDVRGQLLANVVLTGGNFLLPGFMERFNVTVNQGMVGAKPRIHMPSSQMERKFATWIGGSILASLGNFHQMWISAAEYADKGSTVEKRLP